MVDAHTSLAPPNSAADPGMHLAVPPSCEDDEFAALMLDALTSMAARSKRGQADLVAALRGAGLAAEPRRVRAALRMLQAQGAIENLVPLSDGGLLLSVAQAPGDRFGGVSQWLGGDEAEMSAG